MSGVNWLYGHVVENALAEKAGFNDAPTPLAELGTLILALMEHVPPSSLPRRAE